MFIIQCNIFYSMAWSTTDNDQIKDCDMFFLFLRKPLKLRTLVRTAKYSYQVPVI